MQRIYISHPYTGDENLNMIKAENIRRELKKKYPHICYINPLGKFGGPDTDYCTALADAMELLSACHAAIFCPGWEKSTGCRAERAFCMQQGISAMDLKDYLEGDVGNGRVD